MTAYSRSAARTYIRQAMIHLTKAVGPLLVSGTVSATEFNVLNRHRERVMSSARRP